MTKVTIEVNGKKVSKDALDHTVLSVFLRDNLNLTGTHVGCDTSPVSYTHLTLPTKA